MLKRSLIFCFLIIYSVSFAQVNPNEYVEDKPVLMKNEQAVGFFIHSGGNGFSWGLGYERSRNITVAKKIFFESEFLTMKHPKEIRSVNPYVDNAKSFIYGKENVIMILRGGVGRQRVLAAKGERGGIEIRAKYSGGFSVAFAKPVYLNIIKKTNIPYEYYVVIEKYNPQDSTQDISSIYGRASFFKGFDELKPFPGVYAKFGLMFEYGFGDDDIKGVEVGAQVDAYAKEIPIMAFTKNYPYFLTVYVNFLFGNKW